jgi:transposase-like protein
MDQIIRQRRSGSAWREIVTRQEQSGLTVTEFCEQEGLKAASLYGWRVRLRQQQQQTTSTTTSPTVSKRTGVQKTAEEFIDLGAIGASRGRFEVRLDIGGGVLLQLVRS